MKINQTNLTINTRPIIKMDSVPTRTINSTTNVMDSIRLSNIQGNLRTNQAIQGNIQSGISLIQTMDASLSSAKEMGNKLKELAVEYQSGVIAYEDKQMIEKEANELLKGIQKLFEETTFNGQKVFDKPNFSIYTGGSDSYKIETPNVSILKEIKPIEANKTNDSLELAVNLPLLQLKSTNSLPLIMVEEKEVNELESNNETINEVVISTSLKAPTLQTVEQTTLMSLQPMTLSRTQAISSYQESSQLMTSSMTVKQEEVIAPTIETAQVIQSTQAIETYQTAQAPQMSNGKSSSQERKDFTDTMQDLFGSKKESREFFGAKNDKEMLEMAKKETTESLQQRFVDKGYADKLDKAVETGLFESLGLDNPQKSEPTPSESTNPMEETGNGTGNGTEIGEGEGTAESDEGTGSTEQPTASEGNEEINTDGNTGETGSTGENEEPINEPSIPTNPTSPSLPEEEIGSSEEEIPTIPSTPSNPSDTPYQWNFTDILKGDFIDKNILGVIKKGISNLRVHEEILQSRMNFQERVKEINQERMSHLTQTDMAKMAVEKVKKQMLVHAKETLEVHQLKQQREFILQLLQD